MITFKSTQDLNKLPSNNPAHPIMQELIDQLIRAYTCEGHPYITEDYGYIVLIEPGDTERVLHEIWDNQTLLDIPWEGIMLRDGFYIAIFLTNSEHSQKPTKNLARADGLLGSCVLEGAIGDSEERTTRSSKADNSSDSALEFKWLLA